MRRINVKETSPRLSNRDFERECQLAQRWPCPPERSRLLGVCDHCYRRYTKKLPKLESHTVCNRRLDFRRLDP